MRVLRLEQLRRSQGRSQSDLGRESGVNQTLISAAERGHFRPYRGQLERLAVALCWPGDPTGLLDEVEAGDHAEDKD